MGSRVDDAAAQHVVRTLRALELLAEGPQTQAALARRLAVHRRTARRLLSRLVAEGYAEAARGGRHAAYAATPRLAVLGRQIADGLDLLAIGRRHLATLDSSFVNVRFIALLEGAGVRLPQPEDLTAGGMSASFEPLARSGPLHATAAGKVFLSADTGLLGDFLNQELLAFTPRTLVARADLLLELATVRAQGYAVEDGEHLAGACAVASGVVNHVGKTVVALGAKPLPGVSLEALGGHVREAARACSREIGARID
jgi:IclR family transcriptional regulator, acetate operon repressor